jgi:hypothetical protein
MTIEPYSPLYRWRRTQIFYTGMRPIELFTLEDHQVNISDRWISLDKTRLASPVASRCMRFSCRFSPRS